MNIEISTNQLGTDVRYIREQIEDLNNAKDLVLNQLTELNGMWKGAAHDVFEAQVSMDAMMLLDLIRSLRNLADCMDYAKSEYERTHDEVMSKIAGIRLSNDT